jgi:hypothetical protein
MESSQNVDRDKPKWKVLLTDCTPYKRRRFIIQVQDLIYKSRKSKVFSRFHIFLGSAKEMPKHYPTHATATAIKPYNNYEFIRSLFFTLSPH